MTKRKSINDLIKEFFTAHPNEELAHGPVVDWVEEQYLKLYMKKPRDTWRGIRNLYDIGFLQKIKKGIYKYDPELVKLKDLENFSTEQKLQILKRDGYKCVICGKGQKDGVELQVDHIESKYSGGKAIIENGQTLCSQHNFIKKYLKQTETGKKMFVRLFKLAQKKKNKELVAFCEDILNMYDKHNINGHIIWKK